MNGENRMTKYYMGIDVGLDGAIALISHRQRVKLVKMMPTLPDPVKAKKKTKGGNDSKARILDEKEFIRIIQDINETTYGDLFVCVEKQQFFTSVSRGESKKMEQYGFIKGVLRALGIPFIVTHPLTWQAALKFPKKSMGKTPSIDRAEKEFSREIMLPTKRCYVPKDGIADALNIADYIRLEKSK